MRQAAPETASCPFLAARGPVRSSRRPASSPSRWRSRRVGPPAGPRAGRSRRRDSVRATVRRTAPPTGPAGRGGGPDPQWAPARRPRRSHLFRRTS